MFLQQEKEELEEFSKNLDEYPVLVATKNQLDIDSEEETQDYDIEEPQIFHIYRICQLS